MKGVGEISHIVVNKVLSYILVVKKHDAASFEFFLGFFAKKEAIWVVEVIVTHYLLLREGLQLLLNLRNILGKIVNNTTVVCIRVGVQAWFYFLFGFLDYFLEIFEEF